MKINVSKSELMECIENAVQKVMDEGLDEIQGGKDRRHGKNADFGDKPRQTKMAHFQKKGNRGNQNWLQNDEDDLEQVAESKQPRRRKK